MFSESVKQMSLFIELLLRIFYRYLKTCYVLLTLLKSFMAFLEAIFDIVQMILKDLFQCQRVFRDVYFRHNVYRW
jgi:hypothetical protein